MRINITQEQKEIIESKGFMVVQVKLLILKTRAIQEKVRQRARMIREKMQKAVENMAERVKKILKPIREKMSLDLIWVLEPRDRYKVVKALGLNYKAYFNRKGPYHCRNNC